MTVITVTKTYNVQADIEGPDWQLERGMGRFNKAVANIRDHIRSCQDVPFDELKDALDQYNRGNPARSEAQVAEFKKQGVIFIEEWKGMPKFVIRKKEYQWGIHR